MSDNEYLYKLGVDASDLDSAISATVTVLGELENLLGAKMPRATAAMVGGLEKVRSEMNGVATDSSKVVAGVEKQATAFDGYLEKLRLAQAAYKTLREDLVTGLPSGEATFNPSTATDAQLREIVDTDAAAHASVVSAAKAELATRKSLFDEEQAYHQSMQDAIVASARASEERRVELEKNQAAAVATATEQSTRERIAAEAQVTAAVEAQVAARASAMERELAAARAIDAEIAASSKRYGTGTGDNVIGTGATNGRNTAARNAVPVSLGGVQGAARASSASDVADAESSESLSAMRAYYSAQEDTAKGTERLTKLQATQAENAPRLRYALYDVSMAFGILGTGLVSAGGAVESTTIKYEQLFAAVQRTSGLKAGSPALDQLKSQLIGITTELPATFEDVTKIATLGAQLNIPANDLASFTKTVTEFSSETNVSVEASATAFGRLGQILKTTDYVGLGDAIAYLGVKAVATESDIIKVAQQIAVTTTSYGLSEKQTLALSTAYASLGIKAESARGTTSRVFSDLGTAVQAGGTKLAEVARVSGVSATQFQKDWATDANKAFTEFVTGVGKSGSNAKSILAELGITAQRDITNVSLLGQNVKVLNDANDNAAASAGYMDKAYLAVSGTVQSQLTIAANKVQSIFNDIGTSANTPIAGLVSGLNDVLTIIDQITKDPVAAGGLAITVGIVTLTGVLLLGVAALASFKANALAVTTAIDQLGIKNAGLGATIRTVVTGQTVQTDATRKQILALEELAAAEALAGEAGEALAAKQLALAEAQGRLATANAAAGITAIEPAAGGAAAALTELGGAGAVAEGGLAGLLGTVISPVGLVIGLGLLLPLLPSIADGIQSFVDKENGAVVSTDQLTASIKGLSVAGATLAKGQVANALSTAAGAAAGARPGMTPSTGAAAVSGAKEYYDYLKTGSYTTGLDLGNQRQSTGARAGTEIQTIDSSLSSLAAAKDYKDLQAGLDAYHKALKDTGLSQKQLDSLLTQTGSTLSVTKGQTLAQAIATAQAGAAADAAKTKQKSYTDSLTDYIAQAFGASTKTDAVSTALTALGKEYVTAGANTASGSTQMQSAIKGIVDQAGSAPKAAAELETLYQTLVKMGLASPAQLKQLESVIDKYGGSATAAGAAVPGLDALADGYNKAAAAAAKSAKSTDDATAATKRTLMDYGGDLSSTFGAALQYQLGLSDASDAVASGWSKIKSDAATAAASIKGIKADLLSLNADKSQATYDVKIASMYGDTIGEAKAKANLAKANDDIASKNKDLKTAQDASSGSLKGNSDAAIQNRSALEGQIKDYQGYIVALAESGASQKQVEAATRSSKAEFIKHATELGFNRGAVTKLSSAFDDMGKIVHAIPRNITTKVTANTDPAMKAIADYKAAIVGAQKQAAKKVTIPSPVVTPKNGPEKLGESVGADYVAGLQKSLGSQGAFDSLYGTSTGVQNSSSADIFASQAVAGSNYGAWGGGSGSFAPASIAKPAANQGRAPKATSTTIVVGGGGSKAGLSNADRIFLAQALSTKPAIQLSATQFGKAIDGANVTNGMRGAG